MPPTQQNIPLEDEYTKKLKKSATNFTLLGVITSVPMYFQLILSGMATDSCSYIDPLTNSLWMAGVYGFPVFVGISLVGVWVGALSMKSAKAVKWFGYLPMLSWVLVFLAVAWMSVVGCQ